MQISSHIFLDEVRITDPSLWGINGLPGWYWLELCANMQVEIDRIALNA